MVGLAQKELNVLMHQMRPAALEGKGIPGALRDYATDWSRRSEISVEVHVRGEREAPLEVEQTLFRVAQEALANVVRHSGAKSVEVDLPYDVPTAWCCVSATTDMGSILRKLRGMALVCRA